MLNTSENNKENNTYLRTSRNKSLRRGLIAALAVIGSMIMLHSPANAASAIALAMGNSRHTCAITDTGGVKCWGDNSVGQLGNDSTVLTSTTAVDVVGLTSGVIAIGTGSNYSCALTTAGRVKCWGGNTFGQNGNGTMNIKNLAPVDVAVPPYVIFTALAVASSHACAVDTDRYVHCWGRNVSGELNNSTSTNSSIPVVVPGLYDVMAVGGTGTHICTISISNGAKCIGYNGYGQLGNGTLVKTVPPVDVVGLTSGIAQVSGGLHHSCAVTDTGALKCWGHNSYKQLGGSIGNSSVPVSVAALTSGVSKVVGSSYNTCVLMAAGTAQCFGSNAYGQLGRGTKTTTEAPGNVLGISTAITAIAIGSVNGCVIVANGGVKCWGENTKGQLGNGTTAESLNPVNVIGLTGTP